MKSLVTANILTTHTTMTMSAHGSEKNDKGNQSLFIVSPGPDTLIFRSPYPNFSTAKKQWAAYWKRIRRTGSR